MTKATVKNLLNALVSYSKEYGAKEAGKETTRTLDQIKADILSVQEFLYNSYYEVKE